MNLADELVKVHALFSSGKESIKYYKMVQERDPKLEDPHLVYRLMREFYRGKKSKNFH